MTWLSTSWSYLIRQAPRGRRHAPRGWPLTRSSPHASLVGSNRPWSTTSEDLIFLDKDLAEVDLAALPTELTAQEVIQARLDEIDRAFGC